MKITVLLVPCFLLAACQESDPSAEVAADPPGTADRLDDAAAQSDPASAARLQGAADEIRADNTSASASAPGGIAQQALRDAGEDSVAAPRGGPTPAPPPRQAPVNRDGQVVPPPAVVAPNAR